MTDTFYQSLSNGDWLAWSAVCAGAVLLVVVSAIAVMISEEP